MNAMNDIVRSCNQSRCTRADAALRFRTVDRIWIVARVQVHPFLTTPNEIESRVRSEQR